LRLKLWVGVSVCSLAQPAFAQADQIGPRMDVRLSATDTYEDNVLRLNKASPTPAGFTRADYRFTPSIDIDIVQPVGLQSVFLSGTAGYDFYKRNRRLERERINLAGGADLKIGGDCAQHFEIDYGRFQSDLRDFSSPVRLRNAQQKVGLSANVSCGGILGLRPGLSYNHETVTNSDIIRRANNYRSDTYGSSIAYVSPALGEISIFGSYRRALYPNRFRFFVLNPNNTVGLLTISDTIDVYNGGLRFSRNIGTSLRGNISLGYSKVQPKARGTRPFSGVSYGADITWIANDRFQTKIAIGRSVNQSNLLDVSYSIDDNYSIANSLAVGESLRLKFGGSYQRRSLRDSPLTGPNPLGDKDSLKELSGGIAYNPPGTISFSFDLAEAKRGSQVARYRYSYTTARFSARFHI
jgi:Putative beta-barrel porin 2